MTKKPNFLNKKLEKKSELEPQKPEDSQEETKEQVDHETLQRIQEEREYYLNEGNFRYKLLSLAKSQQLLLEALNEKLETTNKLLSNLGSLIEDSMGEIEETFEEE